MTDHKMDEWVKEMANKFWAEKIAVKTHNFDQVRALESLLLQALQRQREADAEILNDGTESGEFYSKKILSQSRQGEK